MRSVLAPCLGEETEAQLDCQLSKVTQLNYKTRIQILTCGIPEYLCSLHSALLPPLKSLLSRVSQGRGQHCRVW